MARIQMKVSVIMEPARDAWTVSVQLNTLKMNKVKEKENSNGLEIDIHPPFSTTEIWLDRAYLKKDGKFQKEDERTEDTRMLLMGRITHELVQFKKHNDHVEWWKNVWPEMKDKLKSDQMIIRWDFIGTLLFSTEKNTHKITYPNTRKLCT
jgi:hypothetical protein